jgi:hypothetical protein
MVPQLFLSAFSSRLRTRGAISFDPSAPLSRPLLISLYRGLVISSRGDSPFEGLVKPHGRTEGRDT